MKPKRPLYPISSKRYDLRVAYKPIDKNVNILATDPWLYVELFLKRNTVSDEAAILWRQARAFHDAAKNLEITASPLLLYYSLLNAVKCLLVYKGEQYSDRHGVGWDRIDVPKKTLDSNTIEIGTSGILGALRKYYGDSSGKLNVSVKSLLHNTVAVQRAFCITYSSLPDLFVPLKYVTLVAHARDDEAWLEAYIDEFGGYKDVHGLKRVLPFGIEIDRVFDDGVTIRTKKRIRRIGTKPWPKLSTLANSSRGHFQVIFSGKDHWYLKKKLSATLDIPQIVIYYSLLHFFSELTRYFPAHLDSYIRGQSNWLVSEFINVAPRQMVHLIACEITGQNFLRPYSAS